MSSIRPFFSPLLILFFNVALFLFKISQDGSVLAFTQQESSLEEENLFRGSCFIPSDDVTSWVTKYIFNVSYDRKQFTKSFSFYTYQSECQQHSLENGLDQFTLKVYLLISGNWNHISLVQIQFETRSFKKVQFLNISFWTHGMNLCFF